MSNVSDATHAYRGYRRQALYTLFRIFESSNADIVFQPEGAEDLSVYDGAKNLIEVVQVKSYGSNLTLSDFKPEKKDSFFYRVEKLLHAAPNLRIKIASYGAVGSELHQALTTDSRERQRVAQKLSEHNMLSDAAARTLLGNIHTTVVDEGSLTQSVYSALTKSVAGTDPEAAFELLHYWLFICSERKTKITRQDVIDRVNRVGKFAAERAEYYNQWYTAIVPIEDHELDDSVQVELTEEFYLGVATRYDHILAKLDIVRPAKLDEIELKFESRRVVIVHGASGQGKTTLAYRYLHEYFPSQWRLQVKLIENRQHALSIATALVGQADAIDVPLAVYLDVGASDRDWPDLVKQLAVHRNIRVLVTIREEDFRRASISGAAVRFAEVSLSFEESEARELYSALTHRQASAQFLTFEEAWRKFGSEGPLMEFVYLTTQGNLLYEKLAEQISRLEEELRIGQLQPNELELLRLVAVASAYDARLRVRPLVKMLGLSAPKRTFQFFEKEYLFRLSEDGSLVQGLHPIRSAMLSDLLIDPTLTPWAESAQSCIPFVYEPDVEGFFLHAFSRRQTDTQSLCDALASYQTRRWTALAGIMRAFIWLGVREYVDENRDLIREAYADSGKGWSVFLEYDVADVMPGVTVENWKTLSRMMSEERRLKLEALQARQTDKQHIFIHAKEWLATRTLEPEISAIDADWAAMAEVLFWAGRLGMGLPLSAWLTDVPFDAALDTLPIEVLADVVLGLSEGYAESFETWMNTYRHRLVTRFRQATQTVVLEDDGQKVTAHFIVEVEQSPDVQSVSAARIRAADNRYHEEAIVRIDLLRRLFPDRECYACQGYGHKVWSADLTDSTEIPGIERRNLPPLWLTSVNALFSGLAEREFRPRTWEEYVRHLFDLRRDTVTALKQLTRGLEQFFRSHQFFSVVENAIDADGWVSCTNRLNHPILLPSCVLDEWGLTNEFATQPISLIMRERMPLTARHGLAFQAYKAFLDAFRNYTNPLSNFFQQSIDVMLLNPALGRNVKPGVTRASILAQAEQQGIKTDTAFYPIYNLAEAVKAVPQFQREFRQLLGQFVDDAELTQIERQEQNIYRQVWYLWYFFGTQPQRVVPTSQVLLSQAAEIVKRIRKALLKEFRSFSAAGIQVRIASEKILWDFEPALWLTIDADDPITVYESFEGVIHAIRKAVRKVPETELRRYLLDFHWPYAVIVPLVRGKTLTATAWHLSLPVLLQEGELKWWQYFQLPIPADAAAELAITTWQDPRPEPALKFLVGTTALSLYAAHIGDFLNMPEVDDEGMSQIQAYLEQTKGQLEEAFQSALDASSIIANTFTQITPAEQAQRPHLLASVQALIEMQSSLLPKDDYHGQVRLTVTDIAEWAERLKKAREYAGLVYFLWVSDVLQR